MIGNYEIDRQGVRWVRLTILGPPRTKSNISAWSKKGVKFTPAEVVAYELGVAGQARQQLLGFGERDGFTLEALPPFRGPVSAEFHFYFPRKPTRSDVQNFFKSVCDALNGVLWTDDSQIQKITGAKSCDKERPRIELKVVAIRDEGV